MFSTLTPTDVITSAPTTEPAERPIVDERRLERISAKIGIAFTACQLAVMVAMAIFVLPNGGSPSDPALERGRGVLDAITAYRVGNYVFMLSGVLFLGFLGAVHVRLRRADRSGVLATVALAAGTLLALIWPLAGMLHDVALETASGGADVRILAGWDAVAPFSLAFSSIVRVVFIGAVVAALGASGSSPRLRRVGIALVPLSLLGSATLVTGAMFPLLALGTLGFELWIAALAWSWLRSTPRPGIA